jgi:hypothetical protein
MTEHDRREFLKKLAKTVAYTAPVVYSLAAPIELIGQGSSSEHKMPMAPPASSQQAPGSQPAPWERPPPGGKVP